MRVVRTHASPPITPGVLRITASVVGIRHLRAHPTTPRPFCRARTLTHSYNRRHPSRADDAEAVRHLPRTPRLVPPAVRGTRTPRHPLREARSASALLRPGREVIAVWARVQP